MPRQSKTQTHTTQSFSAGQKTPVAGESELAALGAAIGDPGLAEQITSELEQSDFYSGKHQRIFHAIKSLGEENLTCNPVSVSERSSVPIGDIEDIVQAGKSVSETVLRTLVADIQRVAELRGVYEACSRAVAQCGPQSKVEDIVELVEKGLHGRGGAQGSVSDGSDVLGEVITDFTRRYHDGGGPELSTGLRDLDRALVGLRPGKLGVLAARPSMGKTALASTIRRAVLLQGHGVIEFNLEMSKEELMERELAFQAQIGLTKVLRAKDVTPEELARVAGARGALFPGRWWVDDRSYSIAGIRRKARLASGRMARAGIKTGLVVVDYIQLAGTDGEDRQQSIAAVSRGLKFLAKELGCTVLALSQLNRSCEYREDRRPIMSDLRESGAIEQDADWVAFVYREHMYENSFPPEETELIIRKQRSGPTGTVHLTYNPKMVYFKDREPVVNAAGADGNN